MPDDNGADTSDSAGGKGLQAGGCALARLYHLIFYLLGVWQRVLELRGRARDLRLELRGLFLRLAL